MCRPCLLPVPCLCIIAIAPVRCVACCPIPIGGWGSVWGVRPMVGWVAVGRRCSIGRWGAVGWRAVPIRWVPVGRGWPAPVRGWGPMPSGRWHAVRSHLVAHDAPLAVLAPVRPVAAAAAAWRPAALLPRLAHHHGAPVQLVAVGAVHGRLQLLRAAHGHKRVALGLAGGAVRDEAHVLHAPVRLEHAAQHVLRHHRVERGHVQRVDVVVEGRSAAAATAATTTHASATRRAGPAVLHGVAAHAHHQRPPLHHLAVHGVTRAARGLRVVKVHKPKPAALARGLVVDDGGEVDVAVGRKQLAQLLVGEGGGQAAHIQLAVVGQVAPRARAQPAPLRQQLAHELGRRRATQLAQERLVVVVRHRARAVHARHVALVLLVHLGLDVAGQHVQLARLGLLLRDDGQRHLVLERAVERGQLAQLQPLVLRQRGVVLGAQQRLHHHARAVNILLRGAGDEHVQLLLLAVVVLGVAVGALLDTAPPPDGNLGVGLRLHALLRVAARADEQADEVVGGELVLGDAHLDVELARPVVGGRLVVGVLLDQVLNHAVPVVQQLLLGADLARVEPHARLVVDGLGRGRALAFGRDAQVVVLDAPVKLAQALVQGAQARV
mmetsp:Transcript_37926/g.95920  ORF Transcript_37926/g.95920 Transcript_37926/m.95920 type:complete len:607 (+) Transcript_37926:402-2222(+)